MSEKRAVVDRVEGKLAVLLVGEDEAEMAVAVHTLPEGSGPGIWLKVTLEDGQLTHAEIDPETTRARRALAQDKMQRLLRRRPKRE